jgi:predicted aspartyl protease
MSRMNADGATKRATGRLDCPVVPFVTLEKHRVDLRGSVIAMRRLERLAILALAATAAGAQPAPPSDSISVMLRTRQYFVLSRLLTADSAAGGVDRPCFLGQVQAAFRRIPPAIAGLRACADVATDSSLRRDALERLATVLADAGRLQESAQALAELVDRFGRVTPAATPGWQAALAMMRARTQGPPMRVASRGAARVRVERNQFGMTLVPAAVNGREQALLLDTGAGMSVLIASVADSLGVQMVPGTLPVAGGTGATMQGRVGTAQLVFAGATLEDVPFLVLPDSVLHVRAGPLQLQVRGILGLPVLVALEEFDLTSDGWLEVPQSPRLSGPPNLALDGQRLLADALFGQQAGVLTLDTGARSTTLYPPARSLVGADTAAGTRGTIQMGGAGGTRTYAITRLPAVNVRLGDTVVTLRQVPMMAEAPNERARYAAGNLGQDVFGAYPVVTFNFREMILRLGTDRAPRRSPR